MMGISISKYYQIVDKLKVASFENCTFKVFPVMGLQRIFPIVASMAINLSNHLNNESVMVRVWIFHWWRRRLVIVWCRR